MARILSVAGAVAAVFLGCALTASAAVDTNEKQAFNATVFVPCAAGGAGEVVDLSGTIHQLTSVTVNDNVVSGTQHTQPQGVRGIGETTGSTYQGNGVTTQHFSFHLVGGHGVTSFVDSFQIVGQGSTPSFRIHETTHMEMAPDGSLAITHDQVSVDCD
jgi:hypothetical protein